MEYASQSIPAQAGLGQPLGESFRVRNLPRRAFALWIDNVLTAGLLLAASIPLGLWHTVSTRVVRAGYPTQVINIPQPKSIATFVIAGIAISFGYFVLLEWAGSATIGKLLLGLRVVNTSGQPITLTQSIIRNTLRVVDGLFSYLLGFGIALSNSGRQRLGDMAAGTLVVRSV